MKYFFKFSLAFIACLFFSLVVHAQFTATGTITDEDDQPLVGATVLIKGTTTGTVTDLDGNFTLEVEQNQATLVISYTGYGTQETTISSSTPIVNLRLREDIANLEEVVVTGLASNIKRSNLANSVASIPAKEISGIAIPTTTDAALYGKFKGANISANSGAPGGGLSFKLRGTTSINGSSQPLIIIDGVYIDNSSISGGLNLVSQAAGGPSQSTQDNPSNRFADIDPNDIETIEILKGASAAAIYGSRASGGVVIITTKKGTSGKTRVSLSQSIGWTEMLNPLGVREWTEEKVLASSYADDIELFRQARDNGTLHNYEDLLYGNKGGLYNTRLSISGGNDKTTFFIGSTYKNEEGIVNNTGYEKVSARINIQHQLTDWLNVDLSNFYVNSLANRGFFNNDNTGTTMGVAFSSTPSWAQLLPDENGVYPANPYAPSNFLETAANVTNSEGIDRYIGGGTVSATLFSNDNANVRLILRGGIDFYNLQTKAIFPNTLQFQRDGAGLNGVSVQGSTRNLNKNLATFLVYSQYVNRLSFRTQIGLTAEDFNRNTILGEATNIIGTQTNLDQSGSRNIVQTRQIQQDRGFFGQEEVNWDDKIIATIGVRGDKSSNNGDVNKLYYYPKASLALNIHEMVQFPELFSLLKLRVAYGESGNFATFGSKFTIFNSTIVDGRPGIQINNVRGNSEVGPERQKELETGFDLGILNNRAVLDFTYYNKSVEDLLLNANLPTTTGFIAQVTNAAELNNKGFEIGLNMELFRRPEFSWLSRVSYWKNKAEVTRLDVPSYTTGGFADFLGQFRIKQGHSPTEIIGVGENPDEDGYVVFGDAEPDFQMSFYNTLSWKNFDLAFLLHWKKGGENINLSTLLFDLAETTSDYDDITLDPEGAVPNGIYRVSQVGANSATYIEDAGYLRLREVGLYYNFPRTLFKDIVGIRLGFSGTNLLNFFKFNSYDPEVSNFGAGGLSTGVDVLPFPSAKRYNFHIVAEF